MPGLQTLHGASHPQEAEDPAASCFRMAVLPSSPSQPWATAPSSGQTRMLPFRHAREAEGESRPKEEQSGRLPGVAVWTLEGRQCGSRELLEGGGLARGPRGESAEPGAWEEGLGPGGRAAATSAPTPSAPLGRETVLGPGPAGQQHVRRSSPQFKSPGKQLRRAQSGPTGYGLGWGALGRGEQTRREESPINTKQEPRRGRVRLRPARAATPAKTDGGQDTWGHGPTAPSRGDR